MAKRTNITRLPFFLVFALPLLGTAVMSFVQILEDWAYTLWQETLDMFSCHKNFLAMLVALHLTPVSK